MEVSKKGKKILQRCNRIALLEVLENYKVKNLSMDAQMDWELTFAVAYYITMGGYDKESAYYELNDFIKEVVKLVNDFTEDENELCVASKCEILYTEQGIKYDEEKEDAL